MRRPKRLHRKAAQMVNHGDPTRPLHISLLASWRIACEDGITGTPFNPEVTATDLVHEASAAYTRLALEEATKKSREWAKTFRHNLRVWNLEGIRGGAKQLKPFSEPPGFTASEMREEWRAHWCKPAAHDYSRA